jgi:hypothetical protein
LKENISVGMDSWVVMDAFVKTWSGRGLDVGKGALIIW